MKDERLREQSGPDKQDESVEHFKGKLRQRGGGMALYFPSGFVDEYRLDSEEEVDVQVVGEGTDIMIKVRNLPVGFTYNDLKEFADTQGWEETDEYAEEETDEWYLTYQNREGNVRIETDSEAQIDGSVVNNVIVRSKPIDVTGDVGRYNRLLAIARRKDLRVQVTDSQGLWQRFRSSAELDTDDAPDEETFQEISDAADRITAEFVCHRSSMKTSLADVKRLVGKVERAYNEL